MILSLDRLTKGGGGWIKSVGGIIIKDPDHRFGKAKLFALYLCILLPLRFF